MRATKLLVLILVVALVVTACRGSDEDTASPTTEPPVTAPTDQTPAPTEPTTPTTLEVAPISYVNTGVTAVYQVWDTSQFIPVHDSPGTAGAVVTRMAPSARDITTTGLEADVDGDLWLEIELSGGETGWIPAEHLVHQIEEMASGPSARYVVGGLPAGDTLNVRADPGVDHGIVAVLKSNSIVQATGARAEVQGAVWSEVVYETGQTGWVNARYLTPEVVVLADDTPATYMVTGLQGSERLNVREGPGVYRDAIATLAADAVDIESTGERAQVAGSVWREIKLTGGKTGWVNSSYLRLQPPAPTPTPSPCRPGGDTFCPNMEVSRGMAAAFLSRALGLTDDGGKDWFTDDNGSTFEPEINRLAAAGVLRGCDAGNVGLVCPDEPVDRATLAALFSRALGLTDDGGKDWFTDDNGTLYETDINRLAAAGIARPCKADSSEFCPANTMRRGQIAAWLVRAFDLPTASQDYWVDDNGTAFETDINSITEAGIAHR